MKYIAYIFIAILCCFESSAQNNTIPARVKYGHGNIAFEAKDYSGALMIYEECLRQYPPFPEAQFGAARAAYYAGNYVKAKKYIMAVLATRDKAYKARDEYWEAVRLAALIEDRENQPFIEMVPVQGGTFTIGCQPGRDSDCEEQESPSHRVTVSDFYIAKYETTQAQWKALMGKNPSGFSGCDDCPVENVSWDDVQLFIDKLNEKYPGNNYRLPTEAEWEFAARGGNKSKGYKYSGSNNPDESGWFSENAGNMTHPAGKKAPNELGLFDVGGNVWEWCSDIFTDYTELAAMNPKGAPNGTHHTNRGGSWQYTAKYLRPPARGGLNPFEVSNDLGFRLARSSAP